MIPENSVLGNLRLTEVYEYYDFPRLYACQNLTGQHYLALWVEDVANKSRWLFAPLSEGRLSEIETGHMPVQLAFTNNEHGFVYEGVETEGSWSMVPRESERLQQDDLPAATYFLNHPAGAQRPGAVPLLAKYSREHLSASADFTIRSEGFEPNRIPIHYLGVFLRLLQGLVDSIGQAVEGSFTARGQVPDSIRLRTALSAVGAHGGSFGVYVRAEAHPRLIGEDLITSSLRELSRLLDSGDRPAQLKEVLLPLKPRAITNYRKFLQHLVSANADLTAAFADPSGHYQETLLEGKSAAGALKIVEEAQALEPNVYEVQGTLVGLNVRLQSFEILASEASNQRYSGKYAPEALSVQRNPPINLEYKCRIEEREELNVATGETKVEYILLRLERIGSAPRAKDE